ncbi:NADPH-dependent cinnamyl-alcohol dehydrogenase [Scheffersomyces amazonensis]|uniref:NADPH-dependent cinnamyl-alcohol dehydrogenase n=1 Tax=Scheffersomyces amazonensis TaxID=1078765 RepID=UPI00315D6B42
MTAQTVIVTGATGFIAQHVVGQLLDRGYIVIGQVRSSVKGIQLLKDFNHEHFSYEVVEVLEKDGAFDKVLLNHPEATVFIHTASPVSFSVENNERDLLDPAIQGTKNVLVSIKKFAPQIRKVVYTSSAITATSFSGMGDTTFSCTDDTWNPISYEQGISGDSFEGYSASKKFAELAAWNFIKEEKPNFTLSTILPVYVLGPQAFISGLKNLNLTAQVVADVLNFKKGEPIPELENSFVDVRDVARAHIEAFEKDAAQGKRLYLTAEKFSNEEMVDIVRKNFPEVAGKLPVAKPIKRTMLDKSNDAFIKIILGKQYYGLEKTVVDSIKQLLDHST